MSPRARAEGDRCIGGLFEKNHPRIIGGRLKWVWHVDDHRGDPRFAIFPSVDDHPPDPVHRVDRTSVLGVGRRNRGRRIHQRRRCVRHPVAAFVWRRVPAKERLADRLTPVNALLAPSVRNCSSEMRERRDLYVPQTP